ncbi:MAG: serine hydrolase [Spirochaetes bacterium]|nr:serine hydrolase [Spirochaetota bacterium]
MNASPSAKTGFATAPGFSRVAEAFDAQLARGLHFGAQLCVRSKGEVVVDRWGGFADDSRRRELSPNTPFMAYSATKAFTATCIHRLADEGRLDLDAPVAAYWPAFGAKGKERITISQVLLHQAGIPGKATVGDIVSWLRPRSAARRAASLAPHHEPGERTLYHAFTAGFVLGELIRRASGLDAAEYLARSFLEPLGMADSRAGLPWREYGLASRIYTADKRQAMAAAVFSNPLYRGVYLPAASLNTTARDLSIFYEMLRAGGTFAGTRYLSEGAVARATAMRYEGPDGETGMRVRWAQGYGLGGYSPFPDKDIRHMGRGASERTFGHSGQGGCAFGWTDPPSGLVFAFTCNRFQELEAAHARFQELADACWESVGR